MRYNDGIIVIQIQFELILHPGCPADSGCVGVLDDGGTPAATLAMRSSCRKRTPPNNDNK